MKKIQSIIGLFIFIVIIFSMNMMFNITENFVSSNFRGDKGYGIGIGGLGGSYASGVNGMGLGSELSYNTIARQNTSDGSEIYSADGYRAIKKQNQSDDQPLYFGFSS